MQTQRIKILAVDDKVAIITAGTGRVSQQVPGELLGLSETLPMNKKIKDYSLFGEDDQNFSLPPE